LFVYTGDGTNETRGTNRMECFQWIHTICPCWALLSSLGGSMIEFTFVWSPCYKAIGFEGSNWAAWLLYMIPQKWKDFSLTQHLNPQPDPSFVCVRHSQNTISINRYKYNKTWLSYIF
jgi:hypothetical protein